MYKFKRSQIILLCFLALLLIVTPLLSSSLRPTYLYFIFNLLIIALSAESGLLSSLLTNPNPSTSPSSDDKKLRARTPILAPTYTDIEGRDVTVNSTTHEKKANKPVVEKCKSEKISGGNGGLEVAKVKKCPSTPSIFFIAGGETQSPDPAIREERGGDQAEEEEDEVGGISNQELFTKAETFIGNFYSELKMQREESWKKIHGLYQKAF
ncbi:hypothetical protein CDL15_Pgr007336 [Punica granatum]|uniref:DUF4408 domain-containing protein n=1 Tax=Punica granatum TaxID=22663 RepID=A0A218X953_PUNGR|nr:hypothetical protein CDL15_Pgr007336 [Punica granatum]PKI67731.1 hypothetical protein CRG98_011944 [Punica granatum]